MLVNIKCFVPSPKHFRSYRQIIRREFAWFWTLHSGTKFQATIFSCNRVTAISECPTTSILVLFMVPNSFCILRIISTGFHLHTCLFVVNGYPKDLHGATHSQSFGTVGFWRWRVTYWSHLLSLGFVCRLILKAVLTVLYGSWLCFHLQVKESNQHGWPLRKSYS